MTVFALAELSLASARKRSLTELACNVLTSGKLKSGCGASDSITLPGSPKHSKWIWESSSKGSKTYPAGVNCRDAGGP